jgi:hypothetical protein
VCSRLMHAFRCLWCYAASLPDSDVYGVLVTLNPRLRLPIWLFLWHLLIGFKAVQCSALAAALGAVLCKLLTATRLVTRFVTFCTCPTSVVHVGPNCS